MKVATPVPVAIRYRLRPGLTLSITSVPTALELTKNSSPTLMCCKRDVNGPSCTLIEKNSK